MNTFKRNKCTDTLFTIHNHLDDPLQYVDTRKYNTYKFYRLTAITFIYLHFTATPNPIPPTHGHPSRSHFIYIGPEHTMAHS